MLTPPAQRSEQEVSAVVQIPPRPCSEERSDERTGTEGFEAENGEE